MLEVQLTEGEDFVKKYTKNKKYIILTSVTKEFSEMTYNWYLSLKKLNLHKSALAVALDYECYQQLKKYNIPCVFLDAGISSNNTGKEWIENEKSAKLLSLFYLYKNYSFDIIMADVDIFFLKNPLLKLDEILKKECFNVIVMSDKPFVPFNAKRKFRQEIVIDKTNKSDVYDFGIQPQYQYGCENGGFCYIMNKSGALAYNYNENNIRDTVLNYLNVFFKNSDYYNKFPRQEEAGNLQTISNYRLKELDINVKVLDCYEFVNGSMWKIDYIKTKIRDTCYLVHYNFSEFMSPLLVREDKKTRMKASGHWLIKS